MMLDGKIDFIMDLIIAGLIPAEDLNKFINMSNQDLIKYIRRVELTEKFNKELDGVINGGE